MKLIGPWDAVGRFFDGVARSVREEMAAAQEEVATIALESVKTAAKSTAPLHPFTAMQKGSNVPLMGGKLEEEGLFAETQIHPVGGPLVDIWVGVRGDYALIARVQQEGVVLNVTEAMRGYLRWQGLPLRDETRTIMIPARPFIDPGMEAIRGRATYLFTRAFVRGFKTRWFG